MSELTAPPEDRPDIADPINFATKAQPWVIWEGDVLYAYLQALSVYFPLKSAASTSSIALTAGTKNIVTETGLQLAVGEPIRLTVATDINKYIFANVVTYNAGTGDLSFTTTSIVGTGTFANWHIISTLLNGNLAGAVNFARKTVAATATTTPLWTIANGNVQDWTGTPTITNFPAATQAGSIRHIYPATGTVITNNANISVQGNENYTTQAGDKLWVEAVTTTTFRVFIERKNGSPVFAKYPPKFIAGLILANNATDANNDIDVSTGACADSANALNIDLNSVLTKRLDAAWVVGNNNGGLFSGTKAINTQYHLHVIKNPTTGVVDAGFDTSLTAANRPAAYTAYRHIGTIFTNASGNIIGFLMAENAGGSVNVDWLLAVEDVNVSNVNTTPTLYTLSLPSGYEVTASVCTAALKSGAAISMDVYYPNKTAQTATGGRSITSGVSSINSAYPGKFTVRTNSSGQVAAVANAAACSLTLSTYGWTWGRV